MAKTISTEAPGPDAQYAKSLELGVWQVQRCVECEQVIFFPRIACPICGATRHTWFEPVGLGRVHATTVMRRAADAGGDQHLCLVDLDEGFRMMSRVEGEHPDQVKIGDRVCAHLGASQGAPLIVFRKVGEKT